MPRKSYFTSNYIFLKYHHFQIFELKNCFSIKFMEKSFRSYLKFMAKSFIDWVIYKTSFPANIYLIKFNNRYI